MHVMIYRDWFDAQRDAHRGHHAFTVDAVCNGYLHGRKIKSFAVDPHALDHPNINKAMNIARACIERHTTTEGVKEMGNTSRAGMLCVGGPKHGERIAMREADHMVTIAQPQPFRAYGGTVGPDYGLTVNTSVYTVDKVGIDRRSLRILRHESLSRTTAASAALDILFTEAGGTLHD